MVIKSRLHDSISRKNSSVVSKRSGNEHIIEVKMNGSSTNFSISKVRLWRMAKTNFYCSLFHKSAVELANFWRNPIFVALIRGIVRLIIVESELLEHKS